MRTAWSEDFMLLLSKALAVAFEFTTSLIIYAMSKNSRGVFSFSLGTVTGTYMIVTDFSQALLLGQINYSTTTLRKNLNIGIVSKVRLRLRTLRQKIWNNLKFRKTHV